MPVFNNCPPPYSAFKPLLRWIWLLRCDLLHLLQGLFFSSPLDIFLGVLEISRGRCVLAVSSGVGSDEYSRDDYNSGLTICVDMVVDGWSLNYDFNGALFFAG